jgi:hypothetical protein
MAENNYQEHKEEESDIFNDIVDAINECHDALVSYKNIEDQKDEQKNKELVYIMASNVYYAQDELKTLLKALKKEFKFVDKDIKKRIKDEEKVEEK